MLPTATNKAVEIKTSIISGCVQPHAGETPAILQTIFYNKTTSSPLKNIA
jgi:hypothetical protein